MICSSVCRFRVMGPSCGPHLSTGELPSQWSSFRGEGHRSRRIDCVVLEVGLPDDSGFPTLVNLVPIASKPQVPVVVLTQIPYPGVWELAKQNGAYACFHKPRTSAEDLDKAIRHAIEFVGQMPEEDRYRLPVLPQSSEGEGLMTP